MAGENVISVGQRRVPGWSGCVLDPKVSAAGGCGKGIARNGYGARERGAGGADFTPEGLALRGLKETSRRLWAGDGNSG